MDVTALVAGEIRRQEEFIAGLSKYPFISTLDQLATTNRGFVVPYITYMKSNNLIDREVLITLSGSQSVPSEAINLLLPEMIKVRVDAGLEIDAHLTLLYSGVVSYPVYDILEYILDKKDDQNAVEMISAHVNKHWPPRNSATPLCPIVSILGDGGVSSYVDKLIDLFIRLHPVGILSTYLSIIHDKPLCWSIALKMVSRSNIQEERNYIDTVMVLSSRQMAHERLNKLLEEGI